MKTLGGISKKQKSLVMLGVCMALFLVSLDQTIVSTAMPKIVADLKGLQHISWVFTAYMLASTVVVPIYGKLSDMFGRKPFLLSGIVIFVIGSILSGVAHSMTQLIAFRAIQGLGAGAMMANAFAVVADLFPPAERGKWQGILGGVFGLSSVAGPLLGGYITDNASWRWNFFINIPVGLLAFGAIYFLMPRIAGSSAKGKLDVLGSLLLASGLVSLLLGLVWGGSQYAWNSPQIIGLLSAGLVLLSSFMFVETKAEEPILPPSLFRNRTFAYSMLITFVMGMSMFGVILYIPLFAQGVIGVNATGSGSILTPLMFGLISASVISGRIISKTGTYKKLAIFGLVVTVASMLWLSTMDSNTTSWQLVIRMLAMGIGLGITMPIFNIAVQNAFDRTKIGVVTASSQLFRGLGSTVGTALLGTTFNNVLAHKTTALAGTSFVAMVGAMKSPINFATPDPNAIQALLSAATRDKISASFVSLPSALQQGLSHAFDTYIAQVRQIYASSITLMFLVAAVIAGIALVAAFGLPELPLRTTHDSKSELEEAGKELADAEAVIPAGAEPELGTRSR